MITEPASWIPSMLKAPCIFFLVFTATLQGSSHSHFTHWGCKLRPGKGRNQVLSKPTSAWTHSNPCRPVLSLPHKLSFAIVAGDNLPSLLYYAPRLRWTRKALWILGWEFGSFCKSSRLSFEKSEKYGPDDEMRGSKRLSALGSKLLPQIKLDAQPDLPGKCPSRAGHYVWKCVPHLPGVRSEAGVLGQEL